MLTFIPQGGLCNRMRSIDAAMALVKDADTELVLQWHKDPGLNADFASLFEVPDRVSRIETLDYNDAFAQLRKSIRKRWYHWRFDRYLSEPDIVRLVDNGVDLVSLVRDKNICAAACIRFYDRKPYYRDLHPVPEIMEQVDKLVPLGSDLVGIHIRRADHRVAIERSPIVMFEQAMQHEIEQDRNVRFFIATDSPETEAQLASRFPGRIIVHNKTDLQRDKAHAIRDALVDVYCLSRSHKIIGSYSSSFSQEASILGGAELQIIDRYACIT